MHIGFRHLALVAIVAVVVNACGDTSDPPSTTAAVTAPATTAPPQTTSAPAGDEARPVRDQLAWVLAAINGAEVTEADINARFDEVFLSQVAAQQLNIVFAQLRADAAGIVSVAETVGETETEGAFIVGASGEAEQILLSMSVAPEPPHLITGLLFQPAEPPELENPPETWDELSGQLADLAAVRGVLAAEVVDGACVPVHATAADAPLPVGSAFKLYVLGALADAIAAGEIGWDDPLAIRDDLKSLPSGTMQNEDADTEFSVFEFAKLMISISDNTATDHLMDLLGREAVEAAQGPLGHTSPSANVPFLTTRDLFLLKLALTDDQVDAYLELDSEGRRSYLDGELAAVPLENVDLTGFSTPNRITSLEWFASPNDLCRALVTLHGLADQPELAPLRDVLETPPEQIGTDPAPWRYIAFKGGSEPGVLVLAILAERASDGRTFAYVLALSDEQEVVDELRAILYVDRGMQLLAEAP